MKYGIAALSLMASCLAANAADLAREVHLHQRENLHVFQCPMPPVLGTGRGGLRLGAMFALYPRLGLPRSPA